MRLVVGLVIFIHIGFCFGETGTHSNVVFDHSHSEFTQVLQKVVHKQARASRVDYVRLTQDSDGLLKYLATLSSVSERQFYLFTKPQQLAFLINAYNGYQLKLVIDHYPIKSIKDVGNFFRSPWDIEFFQLFGDDVSLNLIEHGMLREQFNEPRIHFAVNCASISCPPLQRVAFQAVQLDEQLEAATVNFLNDESVNRVDPNSSRLLVSKIFDWYGEDFDDVTGFILSKMQGVESSNQTFKLDYLDYDWGLNQLVIE
ncbi:MAG: DUF547 domain-containing protein [Pseudomonadales bacterium]|nr:DUF547 domain-containing protein [Pseudomonadales bacterium]